MSETRSYNSPSRDRAKAETRERIMEAMVRVVLDDGIHAFSVANVADKAGVSHRTVYRHFPAREDLLEGLADWITEQIVSPAMPRPPFEIDEVITGVQQLFEGFGRVADAMRAYVITTIALRWQVKGRRERGKAFERIVAEPFVHLSEDEVREAAAVIRSIASSRYWYLLTAEGGLDDEAAGRAASWAAGALFRDLRARDRAAARRKKSRS